VGRWGGHGGGNRGVDSGVLDALCVCYLLKTFKHVLVGRRNKDAKRKRRVQKGVGG